MHNEESDEQQKRELMNLNVKPTNFKRITRQFKWT